jgi:C4-dicarboxylate transporter, DctQ subunit
MMKMLDTINKWLERAETTLLVAILGFMVVFAFLQVVLRNIFDEGILWGDILLRHLVLWVGFIGASLATRESKHINLDLFNRFLSERGKQISFLITNLFSVFICILLTKAGWTFIQDEKLMGTTLFSDVPAWYFQIIIPIGFLLMAFRFLVHAVANVANLAAKKGGERG